MKVIAVGILLNAFIALVSYWRRALTFGGSVTAFLIANLILMTSGFPGWVLLIVFFISSTLLTKYKYQDKRKFQSMFEKTGNRDAFQVLANGGAALIFSLCYYLFSKQQFIIALAASLASCNADTWATEMGVLSKGEPVFLRNLKKVARGTSGAISLKGTLFSLLGAGFIASFAVITFKSVGLMEGLSNLGLFTIITAGGLIGSFLDSIMGAFLQGVYLSPEGFETEKRRGPDGTKNILLRGFPFVNNDVVNFSSSLLAALFTLALMYLI